jgi:lambda family phage minor tail protein L
MTIPFSEASQPAPTALIELFELQLFAAIHGTNTTLRFHAGRNDKQNGDIVWAGNSYAPLPLEADGFAYNGSGQLPRPAIRVGNVSQSLASGGVISALLLTLPNGLEGAKVTRIRTHARYLDAVNFTGNVNPWGTADPTAEYAREVYFINRKKAETREVVEFELAAAFDLAGVRIPKRQVLASVCGWVYRSAECGYTGTLATCNKSLADCKAHFGATAELPYGAFPGAGSFT